MCSVTGYVVKPTSVTGYCALPTFLKPLLQLWLSSIPL